MIFTNLNDLKGTWRVKKGEKFTPKEIVVNHAYVRDDGAVWLTFSDALGGTSSLKQIIMGYEKIKETKR